jgi:hypothetical protein
MRRGGNINNNAKVAAAVIVVLLTSPTAPTAMGNEERTRRKFCWRTRRTRNRTTATTSEAHTLKGDDQDESRREGHW